MVNKPTQTTVPKLRFPEFSGNWEEKRLGDVFNWGTTNSLPRAALTDEGGKIQNIHYGDIHTRYPILMDQDNEEIPYLVKQFYFPKALRSEHFCQIGDVLIADASEDYNDVGKAIEIVNLKPQSLLAGLHTLLARPAEKPKVSGFYGQLFASPSVRNQIKKHAQGISVLGISKASLEKIILHIPHPDEQAKIAAFLGAVDDLIAAEVQKLEALKDHKKGLMQQLFPAEGKTLPKLRFPEFRDAPEWKEQPLKKFLDFQQPTAYLVSDPKYSNAYETPVLTAGKTFILGYTNEQGGIFKDNLPVIIFDDFTTATQFVDFPFKAKSSAMKILHAKNGANIKFMYEAMQMISYEVGVHARHWISKFAPMLVLIPIDLKEQQKIANCLSSMDDLITAQSKKIKLLQDHKKGLMQQLFLNPEDMDG